MGRNVCLCSDGWIHAYLSPELAVLLNPIHAGFLAPRLWLAEGEVGAAEGQLKVGCKSLTTVHELPLPSVSMEQRVCFGILCALAVYDDPAFAAWAQRWLSGADRSAESAESASMASKAAAIAVGARGRTWETWAARAATWAAAKADVDLIALAKQAVKL